MKITKRQLRRLIREHQGTLNEGVWEYVTDYIDPSGIFSGAGAGIDEDELKSIASPDAWILFKALGGLGTDEDAVVKVIDRRASKPGGLKKLSAEFDQLRRKLVEMRGSAKANILQGILGFVGGAMASSFRSKNPNAESLKYIEPTTAAGLGAASIAKTAGLSPGMGVNIASATSASAQVGINKLMQTLQNRDLATWLASDGMEREAQMVRQAVQGAPAMASNMGESRKIRLTKRQLKQLVNEARSGNRIKSVARLAHVLLEQDDELMSTAEDNAEDQAEEERQKTDAVRRFVQEVGSILSTAGGSLVDQLEAVITDEASNAMGFKDIPPRQLAETLLSSWAEVVVEQGVDAADQGTSDMLEDLATKAMGK